VLQAIAGNLWFVTVNAIPGNAHMTLQAGSAAGATANQFLRKFGPFYGYPNSTNVMDDSGYSKVNGSYVITHAINVRTSNANQQWALP
jgi:hypothetical protein